MFTPKVMFRCGRVASDAGILLCMRLPSGVRSSAFMDSTPPELSGDKDPKPLSKQQRRHRNRVLAMQFLYLYETNRPSHLNDAVMVFIEGQPEDRNELTFAEELIYGAVGQLEEIDGIIRQYAQNWQFSRIALVDLAILRLALHELLSRPDIPPVVTINEAIELSKVFSGETSRRFINGILDRFKETLTRPLRRAADS